MKETIEDIASYTRSLIESSLDPLVTIASNGHITDANHATEQITGFSKNELIGTDFADYFTHPEKATAGYLEVYEKGSVRDYYLELKHKDGHVTPVHYNASVYKDTNGKVVGVFAAARDISQQIKAKTQLEEVARYTRNLIESSLDPLVTIASNGEITDVNLATEQITGFSKSELIGTDFANYFTEPKKATAGYLEVYEKGSVRDYYLELKHKDGHVTPVHYNASVYKDSNGKVVGVFAAARDISQQIEAKTQLEEVARYTRSLIESSLDPLVTIASNGEITDVNLATEQITGFSKKELLGTDFADYFTEPKKATAGYLEVYKKGTVRDYYLELKHRDGHVTPVLYNASVYRDIAGDVVGVFAAARDISQKLLAEKFQLSDRVFRETHDGIIITNKSGMIVDVNPTFTEITGYKRDEVLGKNPNILSSGRQGKEFYVEMWKSVNELGYWQGEVWNRKKNGDFYAELLTISTLHDDEGKPLHYVGLFSDITENKQQQEKLELMAHYDTLTKLPNRVLFSDRFYQAIAHSKRTKTQLAICFLDLDNFKPVNDKFGHEVGDKLLIKVAKRITQTIREEDTVCRQGGDEFALLLGNLNSYDECKKTIERIHSSLAEPFVINNETINITVSSGITLYPIDEGDIDTLLRHADQSMYQAKIEGKNQYHLFNTVLDQEYIDKKSKLEEIEKALINEQFELYYQPKVNMKTGVVYGVEALIRWNHPTKGIVPPLEFLTIIEGKRLEIEVGKWVINEALKQIEKWQKRQIELEVSVNISSKHLQDDSFLLDLESMLSKFPDLKENSLELEILESSALGDLETIKNIIVTCRKKLGVNIALDDFGTGYSSLNHLRNLPVGTIKIDQTFVRDMLDDPNDYAIIDGVLGLTNSFHRQSIAEGVEVTEQGLMLLHMGCEQAQGFGIARPMRATEISTWLLNYKPNKKWIECGTRNYSQDEAKIEVFKLVLTQWVSVFITKILSPKSNQCEWPIMNHEECFCAYWLTRAKEENFLTKGCFSNISSLHENIHLIAEELFELNSEGNANQGQLDISRLDLAHDEMLNCLHECEHLV